MKNIFLAGAIAGLVGGIVSSFLVVVGTMFGLYGSLAGRGSPINAAIVSIILTVIFGVTVWGLMYSRFYDLIPGKGLKKGLIFGLMIWLVKDIVAGGYIGLAMQEMSVAVSLIVVGFYCVVTYGLVLGLLYKK